MSEKKLPKETAFKLWQSGKMPDWFYTANYLTPEEARDYYHNKIKQQSQEQADQKNQEKEIEKQIDEQLEKKVIPAIQNLLNGL